MCTLVRKAGVLERERVPRVYNIRAVGHLYVRCSKVVSQAPSCFRGSGKLPSSFALRSHEDAKGKDTRGRRDNISVPTDEKRVRPCGVWGEEGEV